MDILTPVALAVAAGTAAATGALFKPGKWYERLNKPGWTPPNIAFPIVWTILYLAMTYAAWRVSLSDDPMAKQGLALFAAQIVLNAIWSPIFFGLGRIRLGLFTIAALWIAVAATAANFWTIDRLAGGLMVLYLVWVSIAFSLNAAIWKLNAELARAPANTGQ